MNKTLGYCVLITMGGVILAVSAAKPAWLDDSNKFLVNFVNHEFLSLMGVIVSITLPSLGQLHLTLNEIEQKAGRKIFVKTRENIQRSASHLIVMFFIGLFIMVVKGNIQYTGDPDPIKNTLLAVINGVAIIMISCASMILASIMQLIFAIKAESLERD